MNRTCCLSVMLFSGLFFCLTAVAEEFNFVTLEYPPLEYVAYEDGPADGVAVDIVRKVMSNLDHSVNIRVLPWTRAMMKVRTGEADGIFTAFKNAEREEFLNFSDEILISQLVFFYKKKGTPFTYNGDVSSIAGKRIGVVSTISYGRVFDGYRAKVNIQRVNKLEHNLIKLIKGRVDLIPSSYDVAEYTIRKLGISDKVIRLPQMVESLPSYIAFSKTKNLDMLRVDFDAELRRIKESGEYLEIMKKYGMEIYH
jgi:polar amino acid transport system substrate-binding protein